MSADPSLKGADTATEDGVAEAACRSKRDTQDGTKGGGAFVKARIVRLTLTLASIAALAAALGAGQKWA